MKVILSAVLLIAVFSQTWDQSDSAPGVGAFFKGIGQALSKIPKVTQGVVTAVGPKLTTALTKYTRYFPKVYKGFKRTILRGGHKVAAGTASFGRNVFKTTKARFLDGIALTGRHMKKLGNSFKDKTTRAFQKVLRRKNSNKYQKLDNDFDVKASSSNEMGSRSALNDKLNQDMASNLDLPFDSDGTPLSGGPDSPPKKKSKIWNKVGEGIAIGARGLGTATELAGAGVGLAVQIQSMKTLSQLNSNQANQGEGSSTSIGATPNIQVGDSETCTAVPNTYKSSTADCVTLSSDDEDVGPAIPGKLKVSQTLELYYEDKPLQSNHYCRVNLRNLADQRPSFIQAFQLKDIQLVSDTPLDFNREAVLVCSADGRIEMPMISLRQGVLRSTGPSTLPEIPEVTYKGKTVLAWTGHLWFVGPLILNSCVLDTFFTHILLKGRLDFTFFDRNFIIPQNGAESIIREITSEYVKLSPKASKNDIKNHHLRWKQLWIRTGRYQDGKDIENNKPVDYKGHESDAIVERLKESNIKVISFTCTCDGHKTITSKQVLFYAFTIQDLIKFSRVNQQPSNYKDPLSHTLSDSHYKWCRKCNNYIVNYIFVPSSTWMLYWLLPPHIFKPQYSLENKGTPYTFDLNIAPKKFVVHELFYDMSVEFELAYISLTTTIQKAGVYHHLSFQFFNNKFYFYNDMDSENLPGGLLLLAEDPNQIISSQKLSIESLTYFRP